MIIGMSKNAQSDQSEPAWCALCGMSPMPVSVELPDGCKAHPGCVDDPVFADRIVQHSKDASDEKNVSKHPDYQPNADD